MILLDTQVLIWFSIGDERLGKRARELFATAGKQSETAVSPISFWEAAMLTAKNRVDLGMPVGAWAAEILNSGGPALLALTPEIAVGAGQLLGGIHGDPADRIIVATARAHRCAILTADRKILSYAKDGHVEAIDARR
jgi:PIN domain nuclease of toxin-antitoxin system